MVHGGVCLAYLPDGQVALIRGGIPGEFIRTTLKPVSGVLRGKVEEVVEASPDRIAGTGHPGLDLDHVSYDLQVALKRSVFIDALGRALSATGITPDKRPRRGDFAVTLEEGGEVDELEGLVQPTVRSPQLWGYRNTVQPVVEQGTLGYRQPLTHEVVRVDQDPAANSAIRAAWMLVVATGLPKAVREVVIRGNDRNQALVALISRGSARLLLDLAHELVRKGIAGVAYAEHDTRGRFRRGSERLAGERRLLQEFGDFELTVSADGFAQPNAAAAGTLYRDLRDMVAFGTVAHDLYAGGGGISFHLSGKFDEVVAFEIDRGSVNRGKADAKRLGIDNVDFRRGDVRADEFGHRADLITADPPRAGLSKEVRAAINASTVRQFVYVACDPATWARDVADLVHSGWKLEFVRPYDFYPHTHHVEVLSRLTR